MDTAAVIFPHLGQWAQAGGTTWSGGQGAALPRSPRKGTPACLASSSPPPREKTLVHS